MTNECCAHCKFNYVVREFSEDAYMESTLAWHRCRGYYMQHNSHAWLNDHMPKIKDYYHNVSYCKRYPKKEIVSPSHWCGEYKESII